MINTETMYAPIKRARAYQSEAEKLRKMLVFAIAAIAILTGALVLVFVSKIDATNEVRTLRSKVAEQRNTISEMEDTISSLNGNLTATAVTASKLTDDVNQMASVVNEIQQSNDILVANNDNLNTELQTYKSRAELYDKYQYAVIDKSGNRTDLTYDNIATGEQLMQEKGLDPDLLFGIIMTESGGIESASNANSTATGFGQLLQGTAKFTYEKQMGNGAGSYSHSMAKDGSTNIAMVANYLDYLHNDQGLGIYATIQSYRGCNDPSYISTIDSYITTKGNSVSQIAAKG